MADDRPAEEVPDAIGRLTRDFEDFKTTVMHRLTRRPVGDIEPCLRATPKPGTLFLHGQTVSRTTYADLWKWITDNGLSPSVFGAGDGSTTFVLPDIRGKCVVGATTVDPLGKSFGSASVVLEHFHMPDHAHFVHDSGNHQHQHLTAQGGNHAGHHPTSRVDAAFQSGGLGVSPWNASTAWSETHNHTFDTGFDGTHRHDMSIEGSENPTPVFVIQPSYAINWMIWV